MRQEGGSSSICSPLSYLCGSLLARLALNQFIVSISLVQHRSQQGQNGMIVATAAAGGCPDVQAILHEGNIPLL